jgi:hypothetical protein
VCAQQEELLYPKKLLAKVHTINKVYKGRLYHLADSSIWLFERRAPGMLPVTIPVSTIDRIDFKKKDGFVKGMLQGMGAGALVVLAIGVRYGSLEATGDPLLLEACLAGAGAGLIWGAIRSRSVKLSIRLHRKQHLFDQNRSLLNRLSAER